MKFEIWIEILKFIRQYLVVGIVKENYGFPKMRPEKTTLKQYYHQKLSINVLVKPYKG